MCESKINAEGPKEMFMTEAVKRLNSYVWGRLRNSIVSLLVMLALVLSIPHSASAQGSASANLSGTVHDSTGAVVPDANITLRDAQKGTERKSSTNDAGVYVFTSVPPGVYSLSVAKTGFASATQQNLTLLVNQDITQDFILRLESSEQTVTVKPSAVIDEIQEFKVQSHNDEVQFGGVTGGIVNVVTMSGTNEYHASAWEYLRNTALDAKNPFSGLQKLIQNQFGASGGGPVRLPHIYDGRSKTFFYGTYEGFRRIQPIPAGNFYRGPPAAQLGGDFSALLPPALAA